MRLTRYSRAGAGPDIGCIVTVQISHTDTNVVYRWADRRGDAAVVHYPTGVTLAYIDPSIRGYPTERAQAALVARRITGQNIRSIERTYPVINPPIYDRC